MTEIIGNRFNRWLVLKPSHADASGKSFYSCRCDCGTVKAVRKDQLTRGISKSCGCWKAEVASAQIRRLSTTHGHSHKTRTYEIWKGMRKRCMNPKDGTYKNYGGKGITICDRWSNYAHFLADMGEVPGDFSIDRIDHRGNYEPSNCRWASKKTQANNTSANLLIRLNGETLTLHEWSDKVGLPYNRVYQRIFKLSWPIKKALGLT